MFRKMPKLILPTNWNFDAGHPGMKSLTKFISKSGYFGLRPSIAVIWHSTFQQGHETLKVDLVR